LRTDDHKGLFAFSETKLAALPLFQRIEVTRSPAKRCQCRSAFPSHTACQGTLCQLFNSSNFKGDRRKLNSLMSPRQERTSLHRKSGQALEHAAQGGGGVPIPGAAQKTCRCGTSGYGLVGMVAFGGWLDLILEVFSNL